MDEAQAFLMGLEDGFRKQAVVSAIGSAVRYGTTSLGKGTARAAGNVVGGTLNFAKNNPMATFIGAMSVPSATKGYSSMTKGLGRSTKTYNPTRASLADKVSNKSPLGSIY